MITELVVGKVIGCLRIINKIYSVKWYCYLSMNVPRTPDVFVQWTPHKHSLFFGAVRYWCGSARIVLW